MKHLTILVESFLAWCDQTINVQSDFEGITLRIVKPIDGKDKEYIVYLNEKDALALSAALIRVTEHNKGMK